MLAFVLVTIAKAESITQEQALEQALSFLQQREASGSRMRRAPGVALRLSPTRQIAGLYVFNIADDGGFVVVSNDDRALPILGFSDSGSIDPDNMPENMRAWLKGYADEIAWAVKNDITAPAAARGQHRVGSHSTDSIKPLIQTTWNQDSPYNDQCPLYDGANRAATGCAATAMAQVINYHKYANMTTAIPAYNKDFSGATCLYVASLSATTFDWDNMLNSYSGGETTEQKAAVAKLMKYCGASIKMNYGYESYSNNIMASAALTQYFGYKSTTQFVSRNYYSYANWTDLIYFELSHKRPVLYSGQSSGGGHAFVCDGYKYENSTDLFHINWGWGGSSDGYFTLSALNPHDQGIGGSSSTDGFHFGQDAVIGIQPSTSNGEMSEISANQVNLTFNSISVEESTIALGESVKVTINVTNNSNDAYDGDIWLAINGALYSGKMFLIAANSTQDCDISLTPETKGTYTIRPSKPSGNGYYSTPNTPSASLTVTDMTPTNLVSNSVSDQTANIGWTNVGNASKWNLRYAPANITTYNFGTDPKWDTYGGDCNNDNWTWSPTGGIGDSPCYISYSCKNNCYLDAENYLFTPDFELGGTVTFYAWGDKESFTILLNNGGTLYSQITSNFTATDTPTKYTIDLSSYSGTGSIAILHGGRFGTTTTSCLKIDDVSFINGTGDATTINNINTNSYSLTGLAANTTYQVTVQANVNGGGTWSDPLIFTTNAALTLANDATNNSSAITTSNGKQATVTLDRTFQKNGEWHTICLPFNVTLDGSPLAGATAKTLTNATMTGTHVALTFGDPVSTLQAGVPYIIKWTSGDPIVNPTFTNVTINSSTSGQTISMADGKVKFIGYYDAKDITATNNADIYYMIAGNTLKHTGVDRTLKACRAYFQFAGSNNAREFVLDFGDDATGLKAIDNGQLIMDNGQSSMDNGYYDLQGRRLSGKPAKKGLYIYNGRKVVKE